jgi:DNA-binding transcriptional LysR family regulator
MSSSGSKFERNLDWNLLKIFHEIAIAGGISRAADSLTRQQPAVSNALKKLEDYMGVVLCRRGPSGFELTAEGRAVAEICEGVHRFIGQVPGRLEEAKSVLIGQLRVVMVQNIVCDTLDRTIADFSRAHPEAELHVGIAPLQEVENAIATGAAEIGVTPKSASNAALDYTFLYREQHRPFCGRAHGLFGKSVADARTLSVEAFVLAGSEEPETVTLYRERFGWGKRCAAQSPYLEEVRRLVVAGLGIGFLPEEMLEHDVGSGLLWPLMEADEDAQNDVFVVSNPQGSRRRAVQCFLSILRENACSAAG